MSEHKEIFKIKNMSDILLLNPAVLYTAHTNTSVDSQCIRSSSPLLTNTLFSVLSPFVSNLTTYLTRIFVWRPSSAFTLSATERKEKDQHYNQVNSKLPAISHGKLMKRSLGTFKKFIKEELLI